jgi:SAM-dependent methyltransferase
MFEGIVGRVERYYTGRLKEHGATARGVDWNSEASQTLRFEQLLKVCERETGELSILDYGCGYGALVDYLNRRGQPFRYVGFDVSPEMVAAARARFRADSRCAFTTDAGMLGPSDYVVASGIFNVKLDTSAEEWSRYMQHTLTDMARLGTRGMAFNALTGFADPDKKRPDLFYADPFVWFEFCRHNFSRLVALLHNYPLYEFTILVQQA